MKRWPVLFAAAALAACAGSTPTRFWTLEPVAAPTPPAARAIAPVQVAAVHVPLAIDRLEVVSHDAANRVTVHDFDRWSAPPGELIRRTLTQDLVARLPAGGIVYPDAPASRGTRAITVDLLDLRRSADGFALEASWSIDGSAPHALHLTAPAGAGDVEAQTVALGRMTADIADDIARVLAAR